MSRVSMAPTLASPVMPHNRPWSATSCVVRDFADIAQLARRPPLKHRHRNSTNLNQVKARILD